jgi:hypothetical protein
MASYDSKWVSVKAGGETKFRIGSKKHTVQLSGADRSALSTPLLIGKDLIDILNG